MEGLFGYIAVFILGIVFGAIFMKKTGVGNNNGNGGGFFGRFGRNSNQGMAPRPMQGNNMMNQNMSRPGMGINPGMQQRPPGMMPGQMGQPPGGYNNGYNNQNNGGW